MATHRRAITRRLAATIAVVIAMSIPVAFAASAATTPSGSLPSQLATASIHRTGDRQHSNKPPSSAMSETVHWHDSYGTSRSGTVTVSKTKDLSTREIVSISWSGFLPTKQANGVESTHQAPQAPSRSAYPVVLMECQGRNPAKITPEDCPIPQRYYFYATKDALETQQVQDSSPYDSRPFITTAGKVLKAPGTYFPVPMPSDYNDANVIGTNWYATWTEKDGTRKDAKFEVRTTQEAPESLGCGDKTTRTHGACSIVVVPIRPIHCIDDTSCLPPEETNAYSASYLEWQTASNWQNKFVFPVTFKPFPSVCDLDSRPAVPTMGSQMLDEVMLSWMPKFCRSKKLFKLSFTSINDPTARAALTTGSAGTYQSNLSFTTLPVTSTEDRPIVNAPIAITGFSVAFALDDKGYEQIEHMRLDARLLAKLVTESYYVPPVPYLQKNPSDLFHDPEFQKLNPTLIKRLDPYAEVQNPVLVQGNPDIIEEITRYIASSPQAVAWLDGKPDPWGMTVNPHYEGKKWPVPNTRFELRDPWTDKPDPESHCTQKPVMEKAAQFVYNLNAATTALVDGQPQNYGVCKVSGQGGDVWAWSKPDRQPLGQRALIAFVDLPEARQYQLPSAALETKAGTFVAPTNKSLRAAVDVATKDDKTGTILADMTSTSKTAYPGMMPVYAAAPTHGLTKDDAATYAKLIRWMATTGQTYGDAAGQLPEGYLALPESMRKQAIADAKHVADQDSYGALPSSNPTTSPPTTTHTTTSSPPTSVHTPPPPVTYPPTTAPNTQAPPTTLSNPTSSTTSLAPSTITVATTIVAEPVLTRSMSSPVGRNLLPILLVAGAAGLLLSPIVLLAGRVSAAGGVRASVRRLFRKGDHS